jgi:hypothetical protein
VAAGTIGAEDNGETVKEEEDKGHELKEEKSRTSSKLETQRDSCGTKV